MIAKPLIFIKRFSSAVSASKAVLLDGCRVQCSAALAKHLVFITSFLLAGPAAVTVLPAKTLLGNFQFLYAFDIFI